MYAAIDVGSNTLRMLVGSIEQGRVVPQTYLRHICRLAGGMTPENGLTPAAKGRVLAVLQDFAEQCRSSKISRVSAVGTAAFRNAVNGKDFAEEVRAATGLPLRVISGDEEAHYTATGVLSALSPLPEHALIIDIGGGSTEYILLLHDDLVWSASYPLGVVRLTEGCVNAAERLKEISRITDDVVFALNRECERRDVGVESVALVGTAGTVTTLAALDLEMAQYDWRRVNNYLLSRTSLLDWYERLKPMSPTAREMLPGMEPGRGDLIIAGIEIMLTLMQSLHTERLVTSDFGILEGLLLSLEKSS